MSGEIEIGRSKRARQAYSFDDIALVPARRTRDVHDVRVGWQLDAYHVDLPVMASPMDSVMSPATAILIGRLGGIGVLDLEGLWTRYDDPPRLWNAFGGPCPRRPPVCCRRSTGSLCAPNSSQPV